MKTPEQPTNLASRRSFLLTGAALGAGTLGAGRFLADAPPASASNGLTRGDVAILRFLAAANGFTDVRIELRAPVDAASRLRPRCSLLTPSPRHAATNAASSARNASAKSSRKSCG